MGYKEQVPLSEHWKTRQQNQLSETLKKDTYQLIKNAMDAGKSGIKLGGNGITPKIAKALQEWLYQEHHLESKFCPFNPLEMIRTIEGGMNYNPYIEVVWDRDGWKKERFDSLFKDFSSIFEK